MSRKVLNVLRWLQMSADLTGV